jgi:hypothetical protein
MRIESKAPFTLTAKHQASSIERRKSYAHHAQDARRVQTTHARKTQHLRTAYACNKPDMRLQSHGMRRACTGDTDNARALNASTARRALPKHAIRAPKERFNVQSTHRAQHAHSVCPASQAPHTSTLEHQASSVADPERRIEHRASSIEQQAHTESASHHAQGARNAPLAGSASI